MSQIVSSKTAETKKNAKPISRRTISSNRYQEKRNDNDKQKSENREQVCDICAQIVPGPEREKIFAFGKCDHYVCYVCSARLRVICDQNDCPICRKKLDSVLFCSNRDISFDKFSLKNCLYNKKYNIYFESKLIGDAFEKLLKYECQKCLETSKLITKRKGLSAKSKNEAHKSSLREQDADGRQQIGMETQSSTQDRVSPDGNPKQEKKNAGSGQASPIEQIEDDAQGMLKSSDISGKVFDDVFGLKNHLNYVHKLKLCDLCLTHNNLFPFEYSYYDNAGLRKHMREGEPNTSHRGHPDCALCHQTFFNTDELIQHMSREHFHCHLCGRHDSNMRIYFLDYNSLRDHFKARHFLCERDNCRHEQFTSAFDNRIDYQLHIVRAHGNPTTGLSRGEARQQCTITLDSAPHRARAISPTLSLRQNLPPNAALVSTGSIATANSARQHQQRPPESIQRQIRQQRLPSRAEFPALGNSAPTLPDRFASGYQLITPTTNANQFPSLAPAANPRPVTVPVPRIGAPSPSTLSQRLIAGPSTSFVRTAGGGRSAPVQMNDMDFPPLPEQPKTKASKKKQKPTQNNGPPTLDQLISSSLTLSSKNSKTNGKASSKGGSSKSSKNVKQKPLKIQL